MSQSIVADSLFKKPAAEFDKQPPARRPSKDPSESDRGRKRWEKKKEK